MAQPTPARVDLPGARTRTGTCLSRVVTSVAWTSVDCAWAFSSSDVGPTQANDELIGSAAPCASDGPGLGSVVPYENRRRHQADRQPGALPSGALRVSRMGARI